MDHHQIQSHHHGHHPGSGHHHHDPQHGSHTDSGHHGSHTNSAHHHGHHGTHGAPEHHPSYHGSHTDSFSLTTISHIDDESSKPLNMSALSGSCAPSYLGDMSLTEDVRYRLEVERLRTEVKQVQMDFQAEQDAVLHLRKKLNTAEKERLHSTCQSNEEANRLQLEVTRLRALLEKGEAERQNTEYELTKSRHDFTTDHNDITEKNIMLEQTNETLKHNLHTLSGDIQALEQQLQECNHTFHKEKIRLQHDLEKKDQLLSTGSAEQNGIRADKERLETTIQQIECVNADLCEKLDQSQGTQRKCTDNLRHTLKELEYAKDKQLRLQMEIENSQVRIKTLEERVESERASHLETKFNSEIIQLRVQELEGAIDMEKSAQTEASRAVDRSTKQLRDMEHALEDEQKSEKLFRERLISLDKEYRDVKKQFSSEVEDKKNVISSLSKQLEAHQRNFNDLKDELANAKKRQIFLEENYGSSLEELDSLVQNFQLIDSSSMAKKKTTKGKRELTKNATLQTVLHALRQTLVEYRKHAKITAEELKKTKTKCESLNKDVTSQKQTIQTKDKTLEKVQQSYTRASKDLSKLRAEYSDLESLLSKMQTDLKSTTHDRNRDKNKVEDISQEVVKLVKKHHNENEEKLGYLRSVYQLLLSHNVIAQSHDASFGQLTWSDLSNEILENLRVYLKNVQTAKEQLRYLEESVGTKDRAIVALQHDHHDQVEKLSSLTKEREQSWQKQKSELETHYTQLVSDMQSRSQKNQSMADQAFEKMRISGKTQHSLESECVELRNILIRAQQDNSALHSACALLCGALYPLYSKANQLATERKILEDELFDVNFFKVQIQNLLSTLQMELGSPSPNPSSLKPHPLLVFRKGVVAVMAANRLQNLSGGRNKMFTAYENVTSLNCMGIGVCAGKLECTTREFKGVGCSHSPREERESAENSHLTFDWLTNHDLLATVLTSMSEIQDVIAQVTHSGDQSTSANPSHCHTVTTAARASFTRLMERLTPFFADIPLNPVSREKHSLIHRLGHGLRSVLRDKTMVEKMSLTSLQETFTHLHKHIMRLTERIQDVEEDKRRIGQDLQRSIHTGQDVTRHKIHIQQLCESLKIAQDQIPSQDVVPLLKFQSICDELNAALSRECQAQQLLNEQSNQIEALSQQVLSSSKHSDVKLSEAKMDAKRKEQSLQKSSREFLHIKHEKKRIEEHLHDAESALKTAATDKEVLSMYIRSVEGALAQVKSQIVISSFGDCNLPSLSQILLSTDLIPSNISKVGPEFIACQSLVQTFVDTYRHATSKIHCLEEEIHHDVEQITNLKDELRVAARKEIELETSLHDDSHPVSRFASTESVNKDATFHPLREDSDASSPDLPSSRTPASAKRSTKKSPAKSQKTYLTPSRSKSGSTRPKVTGAAFR